MVLNISIDCVACFLSEVLRFAFCGIVAFLNPNEDSRSKIGLLIATFNASADAQLLFKLSKVYYLDDPPKNSPQAKEELKARGIRE